MTDIIDFSRKAKGFHGMLPPDISFTGEEPAEVLRYIARGGRARTYKSNDQHLDKLLDGQVSRPWTKRMLDGGLLLTHIDRGPIETTFSLEVTGLGFQALACVDRGHVWDLAGRKPAEIEVSLTFWRYASDTYFKMSDNTDYREWFFERVKGLEEGFESVPAYVTLKILEA